MRTILAAVLMALLISPTIACSKYKLVNVEEEEKVKEREKMKEELKEELKKELDGTKKVQVIEKGKTEAKQGSASGWVKLYDDKGFTDRILTVRFGRNVGNMHYVNSDDGKGGFNDKASAARYSVPDGWQAVLYENNNYSKRGYALTGSGALPDLGYFSDKCSSLRWEQK